MTISFYLLPIFITITLLSCLIQQINGLLIISALIIIFTTKNKTHHYNIIGLIIWLTIIHLYISIETSKRLSYINQYPSSKQATFTGAITYIHHHKIIIQTKKNYSLTGYLPKPTLYSATIGDNISITGNYIKPYPATNPGQFNKLKHAIYHKKLGTIYIKKIKNNKKQNRISLKKLSYTVKKHIVKQHQQSMKEPYATIYSALIFGETYSELNNETKQLFKKAGLLHAIVVSGSQVSLILGLCHIILNWLTIYRYYQLILLIPISIFFFVLTGGGESVLRAILMAHLMFIIKFGFGYRSSPLHIISLTALIMFIYDPFIIYKTGAILSFLATFSLVFGTELVQKQLPKIVPKPLTNVLSVSIAPWLFTTPILIIKFHSLPLGSLLSNIMLINLIEYIVLIGFTATCIGVIYIPIAQLLHQVSWLCIHIIITISTWIIKIPFADIPISHHNIVTVLFLITTWICFKTSYSVKTKGYSCICILLIGLNTYYFQYNNNLIITHLDIGQGDATLIKTTGLSCLIDTGPPYDKRLGSIAYNVLLPSLRYYGIRELDLLILTHFDQDHVGNLKVLLDNIPIKTILHNGNLKAYLKKNHLTIPYQTQTKTVCNHDQLHHKQITLKFLNTCQPNNQISKNNQSLVFKIKKPPYSILFTGDIEEETEYNLLKNTPYDLKSTLLKVGHHGSKTSTSKVFLNAVNPQQSIISAGKNNRYNHPHPSVISRLKHYGKIWRTDQVGAIIIKLTKTLSIQSFMK